MVGVVQRLERLAVAQEVGGSNPLAYPKKPESAYWWFRFFAFGLWI